MLDDVLMAFDDERAASALNLLAEIGEEQQIVLFTHHAAVKDQVASISQAASVIAWPHRLYWSSCRPVRRPRLHVTPHS